MQTETEQGGGFEADGQVTALANLPQNLALLKIQGDQMISLAAGRPRDLQAVKAEAIEQLKNSRAFCESAVYCKPVGKDPDTGKMRYARGLSIRSAECLAECYGFNAVRTAVTPIDADRVAVEATFTDYQKGRTWTTSNILSQTGTKKGGGTYRIKDDRFFGVICKGEGSRCVREVILRCVPPGLRADLQVAADQIVLTFLDDEAITKLVESFATKDVSVAMIERLFGGKGLQNLNGWDRQTLAGIWTSIRDGEATVEEHFGDLPETETDMRNRMTSPDVEWKPAKVSDEAQRQIDALAGMQETAVGSAGATEPAAMASGPVPDAPLTTPAPADIPVPTRYDLANPIATDPDPLVVVKEPGPPHGGRAPEAPPEPQAGREPVDYAATIEVPYPASEPPMVDPAPAPAAPSPAGDLPWPTDEPPPPPPTQAGVHPGVAPPTSPPGEVPIETRKVFIALKTAIQSLYSSLPRTKAEEAIRGCGFASLRAISACTDEAPLNNVRDRLVQVTTGKAPAAPADPKPKARRKPRAAKPAAAPAIPTAAEANAAAATPPPVPADPATLGNLRLEIASAFQALGREKATLILEACGLAGPAFLKCTEVGALKNALAALRMG